MTNEHGHIPLNDSLAGFGLCETCRQPIRWDDDKSDYVVDTNLKVVVLPESMFFDLRKAYQKANFGVRQLVVEMDEQLHPQDDYSEIPLRNQ